MGEQEEQEERKRSPFHIQQGLPVTALLPVRSCWVWHRDVLFEKCSLVFQAACPSRWHLAHPSCCSIVTGEHCDILERVCSCSPTCVFGRNQGHTSPSKGGKNHFGLEIRAAFLVLMCLCSLTLPCSENCFAVLCAWDKTRCSHLLLVPRALFGQSFSRVWTQRTCCPAEGMKICLRILQAKASSCCLSALVLAGLWCPKHKESVSRLLSLFWGFFLALSSNNTRVGVELWPAKTVWLGLHKEKLCRTKQRAWRGRRGG